MAKTREELQTFFNDVDKLVGVERKPEPEVAVEIGTIAVQPAMREVDVWLHEIDLVLVESAA